MAKPPRHFDIQDALAKLPPRPGIYRMYTSAGKLLYIGKAKSLKNRVRSYFQKNAQHSPKNVHMISQIHHFDYVVTDNEIEALILEDNLIKAHRPKFNVLLKDDKRFPWICITAEPFPRLTITRNINRKSKARYFGPYSNAGAMHQTLRILRKHFPMRQRRKPLFKNRPCMNYYIGTCPGPCQNLVSEEQYEQTLRQVTLFLKGRTDELLALIEQDMNEASNALNFEWAAKLRDRYAAVKVVMNHQQHLHTKHTALSLDVIGAIEAELRCCIVVLKVRRGKVIASQAHELPLLYGTTLEEAYLSFLVQYYQDLEVDEIPDEIVTQFPLSGEEGAEDQLIADWLTYQRQTAAPADGGESTRKKSGRKKKVVLSAPQKGSKKDLLALALENAQVAVEQAKLYDASRLKSDPSRALMELQEALKLPDYPSRMECYDISHVQGQYTVASMVVFTDGRPDKAEYKRFKIQSAEGKPDDFKSMEEVIRRRFKHSGEDGDWDDPDLVIIDGGKGQLSSAVNALKQGGIANQPIISLAKRLEEVFIPNQSRPHLLSRDSAALHLLQQIRDEAHRFAITYHRNLRGKGAKKSVLDSVPGIGEKRKQMLLKHFGSVSKLKKASIEDLTQAGLPEKTAQVLYQALH